MRRTSSAILLLAGGFLFGHALPTPDAETARVGRHLDGALHRLRAAPTAHLSHSQRQARAESIGWLEEYRRAGVFPHNHVLADHRTPVFVDGHGTPCAVGYLLLRSGEIELVREIVAGDNLVRVPELEGDARLERWLDERGLTLDEAARIQPTYGPPDDPDPVAGSSDYPVASIAFAVATATAFVFTQIDDPRPETFGWPGWLGATAFVGHGALLALTAIDSGEASGWQTGLNMGGVLVAGIVTGRRLMRGRASPTADDDHSIRWEPMVGTRHGATTLGIRITH